MKHKQWFHLLLAPISKTTPKEVYDLNNNEIFSTIPKQKASRLVFLPKFLNSKFNVLGLQIHHKRKAQSPCQKSNFAMDKAKCPTRKNKSKTSFVFVIYSLYFTPSTNE